MNPILTERRVLVLNRQWVAVDVVTPAEAFSHLSAGTARALEISGTETIRPLDWAAWSKLRAARGDLTIGTPHGPVVIPAVIVLARYERVPLHVPRFGLRGLWQRDGGRCQYTGRLLAAGEGDIDHVIPRSRGGPTSWENCVLSDRRVNRRKGARTPEEAGLRLLKPPVRPRPVAGIVSLRYVRRVPEWSLFLGPAEAREPAIA